MLAQRFGQDAHVVLGAPDVVAGFIVAGLGQCAESRDGGSLGGDDFLLAGHEAARLLADLGRALGHQKFEVGVTPLQRPGRPDRARWVRTRAITTAGEIGLWMKSSAPNEKPSSSSSDDPARQEHHGNACGWIRMP
jgi:hypothetical protein